MVRYNYGISDNFGNNVFVLYNYVYTHKSIIMVQSHYNKSDIDLFHERLMNSIKELTENYKRDKDDTFKSHTSLAEKIDEVLKQVNLNNGRIINLEKEDAIKNGQILLLKWILGTGLVLTLLERFL